jgi:hypothetical protein
MFLRPLLYLIVAVLNQLIGNQVEKTVFLNLYQTRFLGDGWACQGAESGTKFSQIDLSENKEWMDYDEKTKQAVTINELEYRFIKVK